MKNDYLPSSAYCSEWPVTLYMTKTWGFDSPSGPLQFSMQGWREAQ